MCETIIECIFYRDLSNEFLSLLMTKPDVRTAPICAPSSTLCLSRLTGGVEPTHEECWADSRGVLSRLTRSVELADSGSWASSCEEFRWGLQIRFVRFSIYLVERSVSLSRELCGHRDWVNSRYEPKRIQKITQRRPNEQREQKPNLFGLCRVASEEEAFNRDY